MVSGPTLDQVYRGHLLWFKPAHQPLAWNGSGWNYLAVVTAWRQDLVPLSEPPSWTA